MKKTIYTLTYYNKGNGKIILASDYKSDLIKEVERMILDKYSDGTTKYWGYQYSVSKSLEETNIGEIFDDKWVIDVVRWNGTILR